jgi:GT2 family glycosyltransferase
VNPLTAIVAVGRNEGQRLARCLASLAGHDAVVVYVDSGSTDGSPELARRAGVAVWALDQASPFTAARARNEGLEQALALVPNLELVQFVDGDCEMHSEWMATGISVLRSTPQAGAVCGRVRERNREGSIYNLLCDLEWDAPPGEALSCGGNALYRVAALSAVGGFAPTLICGEEPELCLRLRLSGWRILRRSSEMVQHDADMMRFGQWWRRSLRGGWAYAEGMAMHGASPSRFRVRENRSIFLWGALLPIVIVAAAWPSRGWSLLLASGYLALGLRIYSRTLGLGVPRREAVIVGAFTVLAKFPQAIGQAQFAILRLLGRRRRIIDWRVTG